MIKTIVHIFLLFHEIRFTATAVFYYNGNTSFEQLTHIPKSDYNCMYKNLLLSTPFVQSASKDKAVIAYNSEPVPSKETVPFSTSGFGLLRKTRSILDLESSYRLRNINRLTTKEESLRNLLLSVIKIHMQGCFLTICYGEQSENSLVLDSLLALPDTRQVFNVSQLSDLDGLLWTSSQCRGYIFLQLSFNILKEFVNTKNLVWDFQGRFVFVSGTKAHLGSLFSSRKIRSTENVIGVFKQPRAGEWGVYTNWIYFGGDLYRLGTWKDNWFLGKKPNLFPDKMSNLQKAPLTVATFEFRPVIFYQHGDNGTLLNRYGQEVSLVRQLAKTLNATLVFNDVSPTERWGLRLKNGSWSGMNRLLFRAEVDIGICGLYINLDRTSIMQFTVPYTRRDTRVLLGKPQPLPKWERILYPFEFTTWMAIIIGMAIIGFLFYGLVMAAQYSGGENRDMQSLTYAYLYTSGIHFMEGHSIVPRRRSIQIFISFLWLYAMVITTGYNSNLTALLMVSRKPLLINTFKELYDSGMDLYVNGKGFRASLMLGNNPDMQGLAMRSKLYRKVTEELIASVRKGEASMLANEASLQYLAEMRFKVKEMSLVRFMKEPFYSYNIALATPLGSPLTRKFDVIIGRLVQGGIIDRWFKESIEKAKKEADDKMLSKKIKEKINTHETMLDEINVFDAGENGAQPLTIEHLEGFFYTLVAGFMVSAIAFSAERLLKMKRR